MMEDRQKTANFIQSVQFTDEKSPTSTKQDEENSGYKQNKQKTNVLASRHGKPKKLHERPNSSKSIGQRQHKNPRTREINRRTQMFQQQQDQYTWPNPSGHNFRNINSKKLHDTIGRHQYNKYHGKRHHGQIWPTPNNGTTTKTRWEKINQYIKHTPEIIQMDIPKIPKPMYETRQIKKPCSKIYIQTTQYTKTNTKCKA